MNPEELVLEKLSVCDGDEYTDFLMEAYKDQFHARLFADRETVRRRWLWEYVDAPTAMGEKPLIWVLRADGKMAGQMCVMPVTLNVKGRPYKAGWCQDFIVLPAYRKKGWGHSIVQQVTNEARKHVEALLAVVASEASYRVFRKASYRDIGFATRGVTVTDPRRLAAAVSGNPVARTTFRLVAGAFFCGAGGVRRCAIDRSVRVSVYDGPAGVLGNFYARVAGELRYAIARDADFVSWRFMNRPLQEYRILAAWKKNDIKGYVVLRESMLSKERFCGVRTGVIVDILYDLRDRGTGIALIDGAIRYFKDRTDIVRFDFLDQRLLSVAWLSGFINASTPNRFYIAPFTEELQSVADDGFTGGWHLTYGDSDLDLF